MTSDRGRNRVLEHPRARTSYIARYLRRCYASILPCA